MNSVIKLTIVLILCSSSYAAASSMCQEWKASGRLKLLTNEAKTILAHHIEMEDNLEISADKYAEKVCNASNKKLTKQQCSILKNVAASLVDQELRYSAFKLCEMFNSYSYESKNNLELLSGQLTIFTGD
ncbi:hypothetical protein [Aliivibrio fischeri]|uniref:hypothetical protein n=1 Tax=Aliivibrio fischeri TaxID=668 RepID=UPI00080DDEE9|nr:hypothetical protein [Aliivibrio fischeri]OCH43706.1 hypothetical protein A6E02_11465 [Aliivibrio fischeri]